MKELEKSDNLWAKVVLAHLKTQSTRPGSETRFQWKKRVMRGMIEQGCSEDEIIDALRFVDLVMVLPPDREKRFQDFVTKVQEDQKMAFLANFERKAMAKGRREGRQEGRQQGAVETGQTAVLDALGVRFSQPPRSVQRRIQQVKDPSRLMDLLRVAVTVRSLEEFERQLPATAQRH